jgi:hypothetical protein
MADLELKGEFCFCLMESALAPLPLYFSAWRCHLACGLCLFVVAYSVGHGCGFWCHPQSAVCC